MAAPKSAKMSGSPGKSPPQTTLDWGTSAAAGLTDIRPAASKASSLKSAPQRSSSKSESSTQKSRSTGKGSSGPKSSPKEVQPRTSLKRVKFSGLKSQDRDSRRGEITGTKSGLKTSDQYDAIGGVDERKGSKIDSGFKTLSLSKAISQRLGAGQFTRRDGLITFFFVVGVLLYSFPGGAVFVAIDKVCNEANATWPCDYQVKFKNCSNASGEIDSFALFHSNSSATLYPSATSYSTATSIEQSASMSAALLDSNNATSGPVELCEGDLLPNKSWDDWQKCLFDKYDDSVPLSFANATVYSWTIMTTIGYGQIVVMGESSQGITIVYSLLTIPMFFVFLTLVTELMRNRLAIIYDRVMKFSWARKCRCLSRWPDLLPFLAVFVFDAAFLFAIAGIFCAFQAEFDDYLHAYYYLFQSVTMIGFGDELPKRFNFQLVAILFVVVGIILVELVHVVMEEWMTWLLGRLVDDLTDKRPYKPMAEQTLEEIMAWRPGEQPPTLAPESVVDVSAHPTTERPPSRRQTSVHVRPFSASRFSLMQDLEDEIDTTIADRW